MDLPGGLFLGFLLHWRLPLPIVPPVLVGPHSTPRRVLPGRGAGPRHLGGTPGPAARGGVPLQSRARHRPIAHTMPPVEQLVGVVQEASTDLGRLATAVNHRLEVAAEMSPAELSQLDPAVTGEPVADDDPSGDLAEDLTGRTAGSARACSRRPRGPARGEPGTGCADGGRAVRHAACPRRRRAAVI